MEDDFLFETTIINSARHWLQMEAALYNY